MKIEANSVQAYLNRVPEHQKSVFLQLRNIILSNLPKGFEEQLNYGMLGYVVPLSLYPTGYHCKKNEPLPFINLASQKNFIGFYHMGIYSQSKLKYWFEGEYVKQCRYKLDMGKSCVRFKRLDDVPFDLIGELVSKMNPQEWITLYEKAILKK